MPNTGPSRKSLQRIKANIASREPRRNSDADPLLPSRRTRRHSLRDGSFEYYIGEKMRDNDAKATGPFIMGCLQLGK